jgi:hypothetical protein
MTIGIEVQPAADLRAAKELLERPFTAAAVEFVVVAASEKSDRATIAAYVSRTSVEDRLDCAVGPENWEDEHIPHEDCVNCRLTLFKTTRSSFGQGSSRRAQEANALKRAAKSFGVGRYLYKRGPIYRKIGNGRDQVRRRGRSGWIPPELEAELREEYQRYLVDVVIPVYGEPIDHGDRVGASASPTKASSDSNGRTRSPARNGGGRPIALPQRGNGDAPAHPSVKGKLKAEIEAGGFSGDTVANLAELLYRERISDRLSETQLADLTGALQSANAGAVSEATLGGLAERGLRQPDRGEAAKGLLAYLLAQAQRREDES